MKASIRTRGRAAFALAFGILVAQPLAAATRTWSGADAGTNSSWSDASNWGGAAPSAGDDLVFPASPASFTNSNDIASATAFNSITIAGNYTLGGNALTLGSGGLTESGPATTATISLGITVNAPQTWTISNALTVTAAVSGNFEVTKAGSGTLTLPTTSSSIAFAGPVAVAAGTLLFNTGGTAMVISSTTVDAGATLEIDGGGSVSGDSSGNPVSITLNGSGGGGAGALLTQSAAGEHLIATVTLASDATVVGGFTIDGSINGPGAVTLEGNPATLVIPQLQLTGGPPNSYAGLTTTSYVTLLLNHGGTQPAIPGDLFITGFSTVQSMAADEIAPTATVTVDDGIWDLNGFTQTIGALTFQNFGGNVLIDPATAQLTLGGDVTSLGGCGLGDVYGPGPLSLGGGTRTFRVDASGCGGVDVIIDAPIVGTGFEGLTKDGSGILQLTAPNTYLGTTTVLGGGLLVDGAIGEVSLLGGTLGGTGSVGPINSIGGTLQPGDVDSTSSPIPGILTAGATALSAASTFAAVLNGTTVDIDYNQLNATGSVTLGSAALSVIPGYVPTAGDTYTIITSTTGISGTFAGLPDGSTLCANDYLFRVNYTSTSVTLTAVGPAPASHFLVSAPSSATAGSALSFTITALDACNNVVPSYAGTVHFTSSDGQSLLPADATFTGGAGTFSATLETAGPQTITVTDTVTSSITGSSSTIVVGPAAATHFAVSAPATATAGSAVSVTLTALDAFNNTATGYTGTVHFTATDGAAALPVNSTLTNGSGTFSATLKTPGAQTITAIDTVSSSITGNSSIAVSAASATHFAVSAPVTATAGSPFSFTVTALDPFNNTATGYSGTVHFTSSDGAATLPLNSTLTNGTGTFPATLETSGSQTITATDTVSSPVTGTSNSIAVSPAAATHFVVSAPATATAGSAFSFTVTALDPFNNTATAYSGTVHFASSDAAATLPANSTLTNGTAPFAATLRTSGNQTVSATDAITPSINGTSAGIAVSAATGIHLIVSAAASVTAGSPFSVTVTAFDSFDNVVTAYGGTVHFTSSDAQAVLPASSTLTNGTGTFPVTLKTSGNQTITATDAVSSSINGASNTIVVSPAVATHLAVSAPASATGNVAFNVLVTALDAFNNTATGYAGTLHFTSSDALALLPANSTLTYGTGTFPATLETAGSQTVTATDTVSPSVSGTSTAIGVSTQADLAITKSGPAAANPGSNVTYTIGVINNGPSAAAERRDVGCSSIRNDVRLPIADGRAGVQLHDTGGRSRGNGQLHDCDARLRRKRHIHARAADDEREHLQHGNRDQHNARSEPGEQQRDRDNGGQHRRRQHHQERIGPDAVRRIRDYIHPRGRECGAGDGDRSVGGRRSAGRQHVCVGHSSGTLQRNQHDHLRGGNVEQRSVIDDHAGDQGAAGGRIDRQHRHGERGTGRSKPGEQLGERDRFAFPIGGYSGVVRSAAPASRLDACGGRRTEVAIAGADGRSQVPYGSPCDLRSAICDLECALSETLVEVERLRSLAGSHNQVTTAQAGASPGNRRSCGPVANRHEDHDRCRRRPCLRRRLQRPRRWREPGDPEPGGRQPCCRERGTAGRRAGRRVLLGPAGDVRACAGRVQGRGRLLRRREVDGALRDGGHRDDWPCGVGRDHLRSEEDFVRAASAALLLRGARSDRAQPAGPGQRAELSFGDLLRLAGAGARRASVRRPAHRGENLPAADRDEDRAAEGLLSGRGVSPGLSDPPSGSAIHRLQRPAEDRGVEAGLSAALPGEPGASGGALDGFPALAPV